MPQHVSWTRCRKRFSCSPPQRCDAHSHSLSPLSLSRSLVSRSPFLISIPLSLSISPSLSLSFPFPSIFSLSSLFLHVHLSRSLSLDVLVQDTLGVLHCTATSTLFWDQFCASLSSYTPDTRRVICSTWYPCLSNADLGGGGHWCLQFDCMIRSRLFRPAY